MLYPVWSLKLYQSQQDVEAPMPVRSEPIPLSQRDRIQLETDRHIYPDSGKSKGGKSKGGKQ